MGSGRVRAAGRALTGAMNNIKDTLSKSLVSPAFRSLVCYLNFFCSTPVYYLSRHIIPVCPLPTKIPPNQPNNPDHSQYPFSRNSKPSSTISNPPSQATSTKHVHPREFSPSTTLSSFRSASSGSLLRLPRPRRALAIMRMGGEEEGEEEFGGGSAVIDNDSRRIRTIVPHELEGSKGE